MKVFTTILFIFLLIVECVLSGVVVGKPAPGAVDVKALPKQQGKIRNIMERRGPQISKHPRKIRAAKKNGKTMGSGTA
uniref:Uncharacterized protein n=1 Tax=Panagrolaimus sp. JU765 TaxID=591449 RepID=A0AC34QWM4_9BILA